VQRYGLSGPHSPTGQRTNRGTQVAPLGVSMASVVLDQKQRTLDAKRKT